jgi:hypothetical protein
MKNPRISKVALLACAATMSVACADAPADLEIVYLADEDELSFTDTIGGMNQMHWYISSLPFSL